MVREQKNKERRKYEKLGRQLEHIFEGGYLNHRRVYKINFFRGMFFGLGAALGGTMVIAFILWLLSLFTQLPIIGRLAQTIHDSIQVQ